MFASCTRRASLIAAAVTALGLVAATPAQALEGVQGRHAIFYPSLELVYQHDDNYFLSRDNEVSADTFIAHAHFRLEVPGSRQYLALEYAPQYRSVDVNQGGDVDIDEDSHFWTLDAKLRGSAVFGVDIAQKATLGVLEVGPLDENRELVRTEERFFAHDLDVAFKWEGSRQNATVRLGKADTAFDESDNAPSWYELNGWRIGAEYGYKFTPLSSFLVGWNFRDNQQDYTQKAVDSGFPSRLDSQSNEVYFGFRGELGRTTTGHAKVGFVALDFDDALNRHTDWDGVSLAADVTKSFSRYSKLIFGAQRKDNYSAYGTGGQQYANTYYVSNRASFTFSNQPQGGRVGWTLAGAFQRNAYDQPTPDANGVVHEREDDIVHLRGEVGYHALEHLSFRLNYRYEDRDSSHPEFDYTDNLVIFQVQFGF